MGGVKLKVQFPSLLSPFATESTRNIQSFIHRLMQDTTNHQRSTSGVTACHDTLQSWTTGLTENLTDSTNSSQQTSQLQQYYKTHGKGRAIRPPPIVTCEHTFSRLYNTRSCTPHISYWVTVVLCLNKPSTNWSLPV